MRKSDIIRKKHQTQEVLRFLQAADGVVPVTAVNDINYVESALDILRALKPSTVVGMEKVRIGGELDGSYVMLDPGYNGIVYSFGVSNYSPWDLAMAERGFKVYQYDASIEHEPDTHPNIFFNKLFVCSSKKLRPGYISFEQMLADNGHLDERDMILAIDVEGGEWDIFEHMSESDIKRFKQIIVEYHRYHFLAYPCRIMSKLRETHTPIHVHYNNSADPLFLVQEEILYNSCCVEVSYVRNDDFEFVECTDFFPTALDRVSVKNRPEIPLGYFDLITRT